MGIFNLKDYPNTNADFVTVYEKLVREKHHQAVDTLQMFDDIEVIDDNELYLFNKNENENIDAILTGIHMGDAGFIGYILIDKHSDKVKLTRELYDFAEMEFKRKSQDMKREFIGMFTEVYSYYDNPEEGYVCPYTQKEIEAEQLLVIQNRFYPINLEYVEPSLEHGVLDQYAFLCFRKANSSVTMKVRDLFNYVTQIYSISYGISGELLATYMRDMKEASELREDFFAEHYEITNMPKYDLYQLGENPY
jgi:hypothetical protein